MLFGLSRPEPVEGLKPSSSTVGNLSHFTFIFNLVFDGSHFKVLSLFFPTEEIPQVIEEKLPYLSLESMLID